MTKGIHNQIEDIYHEDHDTAVVETMDGKKFYVLSHHLNRVWRSSFIKNSFKTKNGDLITVNTDDVARVYAFTLEDETLATLIAQTKNSIDSKTFQEYYVRECGEKKEVLDKGDKSCSSFVVQLYKVHDLLEGVKLIEVLTVHKLLRALKEHEKWKSVKNLEEEPLPGDLVFYGEGTFSNGTLRKHVGIYVGNGKVVSNDGDAKVPREHDWHNYKDRPVSAIFRHKDLS